jgi:hypothetical protein
MNLNPPTMTYIVICIWLVFHHPTQFVLSSAHLWVLQCLHERKDGRREAVGGSVRQTSLPNCFSLPKMGNCKVLKIYTVSSNETEIHVFKTFINHIGRPDKSVQQAGCDPWAVVLRALI